MFIFSQNSYADSTVVNVIVFRARYFMVLKVKEVIRTGPRSTSINVLISKDGRTDSCPCTLSCEDAVSRVQAKKRVLTRNQICWTLIWDF